MTWRPPFFAGFLLITICGLAGAQTRPTTTTGPAPHLVNPPPGFKSIVVRDRTVLLEAADEQWVRKVLETVTPTTMPTTMPADVTNGFRAAREQIKTRLVADFALPDPAAVDKFFDETFEPELKRLQENVPKLIYMISSEARVKELLKAGWSDERYYYNRAADAVMIANPQFSIEKVSGEVLWPVLFPADTSADKKSEGLSEVIRRTENGLAWNVSRQSVVDVEVKLANFINDQTVKPLKLAPDVEWFAIGAASLRSSQYAATITGYPASELLNVMTADLPANPLRAAGIDLLHPNKESDMRPGAVVYYREAQRRKATRVIRDWAAKAGDDAIAKMFQEIRKNPPADGPALLKQIQQTSGIDLTKAAGRDF